MRENRRQNGEIELPVDKLDRISKDERSRLVEWLMYITLSLLNPE